MSIIKGTNKIVAGFGGTKRSIGEVYFSQSSLATDNSGALPLFTGETIASANTIYPDFYNWVLSHAELQCTSAEYESALRTYGECPKYVVIASLQNNTPSVSEIISMSDDVMTLYYLRGTEISIDDPVFRSYEDAINNENSIGKVIEVIGGIDSEEGFSIMFVNNDGTEPSFPELQFEEILSVNTSTARAETSTDSVSIRLPLLKNYIKAANTAEGIKNIEAGLPDHNHNIVGSANYSGTSNNAFGNGTSNPAMLTNIVRPASESNPIYGKSATVTPASTTLYPWVVAYTAAIPASTAQAAEFQQGLSGKADTNLGNIPSNYDYVVESYNDGINWYKKYKSGWLEQGGLLNVSNATVTFPKPFSVSPATILLCNTNTGSAYTAKPTNITSTSFAIYQYQGYYSPCYWYACGQGA